MWIFAKKEREKFKWIDFVIEEIGFLDSLADFLYEAFRRKFDVMNSLFRFEWTAKFKMWYEY